MLIWECPVDMTSVHGNEVFPFGNGNHGRIRRVFPTAPFDNRPSRVDYSLDTVFSATNDFAQTFADMSDQAVFKDNRRVYVKLTAKNLNPGDRIRPEDCELVVTEQTGKQQVHSLVRKFCPEPLADVRFDVTNNDGSDVGDDAQPNFVFSFRKIRTCSANTAPVTYNLVCHVTPCYRESNLCDSCYKDLAYVRRFEQDKLSCFGVNNDNNLDLNEVFINNSARVELYDHMALCPFKTKKTFDSDDQLEEHFTDCRVLARKMRGELEWALRIEFPPTGSNNADGKTAGELMILEQIGQHLDDDIYSDGECGSAAIHQSCWWTLNGSTPGCGVGHKASARNLRTGVGQTGVLQKGMVTGVGVIDNYLVSPMVDAFTVVGKTYGFGTEGGSR
jgi:hypothetical protein